VDFDFSHGVILLLLGSTVTSSRQELQMLTPMKQFASGQRAFARGSLGAWVADTRNRFPMDWRDLAEGAEIPSGSDLLDQNCFNEKFKSAARGEVTEVLETCEDEETWLAARKATK
jgi:hypothetical protein